MVSVTNPPVDAMNNESLELIIHLRKETVRKYRICSRNLGTFFFILAAEKSGCVKYADFFVEVLIWVLF